jgi:deoxyadenosine/deoxycytidine kinase
MIRCQHVVTRITPRLNQRTRKYEIVDNDDNELYSEPLGQQRAGYHETVSQYARDWAIMLDLPETAVQPFTIGRWKAPVAR